MSIDPRAHPQLDRFLAAMNGDGFAPGEQLPYHHPGCYGCGPENAAGLQLVAYAAEPEAVTAHHTFEQRFEGAPGVVHGGATAAVFDDLFGRLLVRVLVMAVTTELSVDYLRAVHVDEPCELRAELVDRTERDVLMRATLTQQSVTKAVATGRFRVMSLERLANRYEPVDPASG